jgi:hypothetical protein
MMDMNIAEILSGLTEGDFEAEYDRAVAAGQVKGADGFREGMSVDQFDEEGRAIYAAEVAAGRIKDTAPSPVKEAFVYDREECLAAAFREGLVKLEELTDAEKLMCLKSQNARLKAAVPPTATEAASPVKGLHHQRKIPDSARFIDCCAGTVSVC